MTVAHQIRNKCTPNSETPYGDAFYETIDRTSASSARVIVPIVRDLIPFRSVVDVGCGRGAWLSVFEKYGAIAIAGYDGHYVDMSRLVIPRDCFHSTDLAKPFQIDERFDLAVCLEVGEHLPHSTARPLVASLCRAAPAVLFSAAIPGQGGTHHINEQWPDYWRQVFAEHSFVRLDPIRRRILANRDVAPWYKQNTYLFVNHTLTRLYPQLADELALTEFLDVEIVAKPRLATLMSVTGVLKELRRAMVSSARNRIRGLLPGKAKR